MIVPLLQFAVSALVVVVAGTFLSRFADELAERTGLGRLLVGSILLAGATSLPELTVGISAVRSGLADIALGDLAGAGLLNLFILTVLDLSLTSQAGMLSRQAAGHALSGGVSAALFAIVAFSLLSQKLSAAGELLGISYGLWFVLFGYLCGIRMVYYDQQMSAAAASAGDRIDSGARVGTAKSTIAGFAVCAAVIFFVGPYLAEAAGKIAEITGLGNTFVGTTLVALCTCLPELVTSLAAVRLGAHDLAIGNVFGSNAFNMLLLVPIDWFHHGPLLGVVSSEHAVTVLAANLATLIVVLGQLYQVERRRRLIEPDALLVIGVVFGSLWVIYQLGR